MSPTDSLKDIQAKMKEYIDCGVKLGWIINPEAKQVEIYRQGKEPELLDNPSEVLGENVLPKLVIDLERIWD